MIQLAVQLARLGFLSPALLWSLYRAKKKHGENIAWLPELAARLYPDKTALTDGQITYTFSELRSVTTALAGYLQNSFPVAEGNVAILACNNSSRHISWLYAFQAAGIPLLLIHPKTTTADIQHIRNSYPEAGLFSDEDSHLHVANSFCLEQLFSHAMEKKPGGFISAPAAALIFPSSGSTGRPKMIPKKPGAFYWLNAFADLVQYTGIHRRNAVFISTPVTHGFGYTSLLFSLVLGKKAVVSSEKDGNKLASLLCREKTDLLTGVPSSLYQLSLALSGKSHPVKLIISGGAPLNEQILSVLSTTLSKNLFSFYGSTEASTSFIASYTDLSVHIHAIGRPLRGIRFRLASTAGGADELWINSPMANLSPGVWYGTGDLVEKTDSGLIIWRGRKDNMIIKNGLNIFPVEIENAIMQLPGIRDVLVTSEKDIITGEKPVAWILLQPGFTFDEEQIRSALRQRLAHIKIPDKIIPVTGFTETPTGKKTGVTTFPGS